MPEINAKCINEVTYISEKMRVISEMQTWRDARFLWIYRHWLCSACFHNGIFRRSIMGGLVGTKYFSLLIRVSFSYIHCMRPTRPDSPIGYVGLSVVPQDPRWASSKLCYAWSQLPVY